MNDIEVGDTLLLGSQRIRATVIRIYDDDCFGVRLDGVSTGGGWVRRSDVVEVIKPPKPMPEYQEGDMARVGRAKDLEPGERWMNSNWSSSVVELWRETAPGHLERVWSKT